MPAITRTQSKRLRRLNQLADEILSQINHKPIMVLYNLNELGIRKIRREYCESYSVAKADDFANLLRIVKAHQIRIIVWGINSNDYECFDQIRELKNNFPGLTVFLHNQNESNNNKIDNGHSLEEVYQNLKSRLADILKQDTTAGKTCRYSLLFDQHKGEIANSIMRDEIPAFEISQLKHILPLCAISSKLEAFRAEDNRRICPFHQDINPREKPQKYNIGSCSSYRCAYYDYAYLNLRSKSITELETFPQPCPYPGIPVTIGNLIGSLAKPAKPPVTSPVMS